MTHWRTLLDRLLTAFDEMRRDGRPTPEWKLGGGTALMIEAEHRLSRDIDAFIDAPEYLGYLSPRLIGDEVWGCRAYDEAANSLKLRYSEGEIDFIVAGDVCNLPAKLICVVVGEGAAARDAEIMIENPVEIALKKLYFRGGSLLVRDAFDICVVDTLFRSELRANLRYVSDRRAAIEASAMRFKPEFVKRSLDELNIASNWRAVAASTLDHIREIVREIPERRTDES